MSYLLALFATMATQKNVPDAAAVGLHESVLHL